MVNEWEMKGVCQVVIINSIKKQLTYLYNYMYASICMFKNNSKGNNSFENNDSNISLTVSLALVLNPMSQRI